jgi:hypothetical protein
MDKNRTIKKALKNADEIQVWVKGNGEGWFFETTKKSLNKIIECIKNEERYFGDTYKWKIEHYAGKNVLFIADELPC